MYSTRADKVPQNEGEKAGNIAPTVEKQTVGRKWDSRPTHSDLSPPVSFHLLKVPWAPQTAPPAGD